jgi:hypothetical protein
VTRARGGMAGFWCRFVAHYRDLDGCLRVGAPVLGVERLPGRSGAGFRVRTRRGVIEASQGDPARMTLWGAILYGPFFLPRLWWWAYARARGRPGQRCWLLAEAGWACAVSAAGVLLWPWTPAVLVSAALAVVGSWVFPLLTVHLPHHGYGSAPLTQTGFAQE